MSDDEVIKQFLSRLPKDATRHISAFRTTLTILIRTIQPDPLGQEIRELIPHLAHVLSELTPQLLAGGVKRNFSVLGVSRIKALQQIAQGLFSSYLLAYIAHGKKLPTHGKLRWATFTHYGIRQAGELLSASTNAMRHTGHGDLASLGVKYLNQVVARVAVPSLPGSSFKSLCSTFRA